MNRKMNTLATLLLLVGLLFMLPVTAVAEEAGDATITPASGTCGSNLTWTLDDKGALTISGTGEMWQYSTEYDSELGISLTTAPWGVAVKEVVIEKGVTNIGDNAFAYCSNLCSISLPEGLISIEFGAFQCCSSLDNISLPNSVTSIDHVAFYNCSSLSSIILPNGLTSIGIQVFSLCSSLTSINIPDSVSSIGSSAFSACSSLSSISIPDSVTIIDSLTFVACSGLSSITIPDNVTSIGTHAFEDCSSLSSITLPEGLTSIGNDAFNGCSSLSSITLPDNITSVGTDIITDCPAVLYVSRNSTTAQTLTAAGYAWVDPSAAAFGTCGDNLTWTLDAEGVLTISGTGEMWNYTVTYDDALGYVTTAPWGVEVKEVVLDKVVTSIGSYAFHGCWSLSSISIPDGVTSIGPNAFSNCPATCYANRNSSASIALTKADYLFVDPSYPELSLKAYETEDGTRTFTVADCALDVVSVTFPEGVTSIDSNAFYGCSSLSSISIPDGVTSIGSDAFRYCSSLSSISIPDGVTSIGLRAFGDCPATLYANRNSFAAIALTNGGYPFIDPSYSELSLNAYETEDGTRTFTVARCPKDAVSVTFPAGVTGINGYAFRDCSNLSSISIPEGMTSIEIGTFYNCTNLSSISIPDSVTSIDIAAFYNCTNLNSITIPDGVTSIGSDTFKYCTALTSITIPDGVTTIGNNAFYACSLLSSIYLPNSVTSIGEYGFTPLYGQTTTVYCYEFSYAEEWALQNGFTVCLLDGKETEEYLQVTLPETFTLGLGETAALPLQVFPVLPEMSIVWTSADESVVQINEDGTITGAACGQAVVSVSVDGVTASCTVSIVAQATSLSLPDTIYVVAKQTRTLPLTIEPAGATVDLVYETGNTIYASITEDSLLKGGAVGTTTLTVTDQLTGLTATATVRSAYPVTAVSFAPEACAVDPGETLQLTANVTMRTDSCVNELVTFASSDETIAVVDEKGLLTAKASGTVTITSTAASGVSGSCTVLVLPAQRSVLPAGLVTIEDEALMGTPIRFCVLPGSVSSIGARAFASCTALEIIEIPGSVTSIADTAFEVCTGLIIVAPQGSTAHTFALDHGFVWMAK